MKEFIKIEGKERGGKERNGITEKKNENKK